MKGRLTPRGCGDVRRGPPGRTGQAPAGGWKLSPWGHVLLTASGARVYRSASSAHRPTVGCSPPSVPSEEDVAEPDGRAALSITSPGTERKCPRCLATSDSRHGEHLRSPPEMCPGPTLPGSPGSGVGRGCLRMGGEVDVQPVSRTMARQRAYSWPFNAARWGPHPQDLRTWLDVEMGVYRGGEVITRSRGWT